MVKECVEQGLCTNTLPSILPQRMGYNWSFYCETCWIHCQQRLSTDLKWDMDGTKCKCENCSEDESDKKWNELFGK